MQRARRGEAGAMDALFAREYVRAYNVAVKITGDRDAATEAARMAFVRAAGLLRKLRTGKAFAGWFHGILLSLLRQRAAPLEPQPGSGRSSKQDVPLAAAILALPFDLRAALVLRDVRGLEIEEIADAVRAPAGKVETRLAEARRRVNAELCAEQPAASGPPQAPEADARLAAALRALPMEEPEPVLWSRLKAECPPGRRLSLPSVRLRWEPIAGLAVVAGATFLALHPFHPRPPEPPAAPARPPYFMNRMPVLGAHEALSAADGLGDPNRSILLMYAPGAPQ
ncbi:MAG TPA: RNA polymerase sigma factor [Armatimonadota bacterium]